ncbi:P-loop containing nucleoside triphosphate hydrolase [Vigna unguiculata]|uniref:P-loop containing nucleoside triphosphate hydrolase n=1 Tax=Vigna unguiculata TaxID=3917 RepID=A0A4D6MJD0_VIGUN|nr:P-loop containing nucleoside triphosphate hydrolase [Vigna unguiculata]
MGKLKSKVIIAMKGHPGSGKSTLAESIASSLGIPVLDKDDVKDCTQPLLLTSPASLLNDLSYDVICQIASTQLRLGLSVLLDSPLSRRAHLDRLRRLANALSARLLIIECRPADQSEWRRRLEARGGGAGGHKPATWEELEKLLEGYAGCTEYDVGDVARLVVDTTANVPFEEICATALEFIFTHAATPLEI